MSDPSSASSYERLPVGPQAEGYPDDASSHSEGMRLRHVRSEEETDEDEPAAPKKGGLLTLVATPIGNLGDLSPRAVQAMRSADLVLCEDTRVTARLFTEHNISTRAEPLHEHNERQRVPGLIDRLLGGQQIALVSDAGMPLLSDPGYRLVRAAIDADITITAVPGPNAALTGLVLSGLPPHPFLFVGFAPPRSAARKESFATLHAAERAGLRATLIWHEAPHRLAEMLSDLKDIFGADRSAVVARELTKRFEEAKRGTLGALASFYAETVARGEITVLVGPFDELEQDADTLDDQLETALASQSVKDAAALVAKANGLPKKTVYARALELMALRQKNGD
ncbi:MAG: 16S rRNA (cytidine(1402)-2'-O)-methyltransferase [Acetobacter sp.]|nr:16S rRNA (cytidine(1402)-2'-O)-methyltransferase [Acetobacter sp.]MCH4090777.1 16S rRNA (cytidine(1402)-2'-O)-methyltransferase [Acetobacter sp.]MCI1300507.1 16S rRNA (cytidine(1402)-2'-O)-methyltransferase [Acetobacter sp.]MCI1316291.1 16S rRNA (cytidine(1402)-2'-O)-methyltransferase [Acetobacter sp.]